MIDLDGSLREFEAMVVRHEGLLKTPFDLARYEVLIERVKPGVLVETGFAYGESARWFAARVPQVVSVEMNPDYIAAQASRMPDNVTIVAGRSQQMLDTVRDIVEALPGPVMVTLDSEHDTLTVLEEMLLYRSLVSPGSYMVVEDGMFDYWENDWNRGSPLEATAYYLATHTDFVDDQELEDRWPTTLNPRGWLRRVA